MLTLINTMLNFRHGAHLVFNSKFLIIAVNTAASDYSCLLCDFKLQLGDVGDVVLNPEP